MTTKQAIATLFFAVLTYAVCHAGIASWYETPGTMANGEPFNPDRMTCASWRYTLGTRLEVAHNYKSVVVVCTDRGPARRLHREIDLSRAAFERLAPLGHGLIEVTIRQVK